MSQVFAAYGKYYDLLYQDKDYGEECDIIEGLFRRYSPRTVTSVLDAACGTGGHAIPLAARGYQISAFDASEAMIRCARGKSHHITFHVEDLRHFDVGGRFDACICMFAAMNYLTDTADIQKALANIRRHLGPEGLLIFDFWNGLAVLRMLPETRVKTASGEGTKVIRFVQPELDAEHHLCRSHYHLIVIHNGTVVDEVTETHAVRYFFPLEIVHYLDDAGFQTLHLSAFPDLNGKADETAWNAIVVAQVRPL
jgi:SAM-dependent methyltransferase